MTRLISPLLAGALIASVWQGLVLTGGVALALYGLRAVSPAARTSVWRGVLLLLLILPLLALVVPHARVAGHHGLHLGQRWSVALMAVWAVCSVWRAVGFAWDGVRLWKLARRAVPVAVEGELGALLAGTRRAELCVSAEVSRPSVTGFLRPRVLLPQGLLETLSGAELDYVVRHEMEHLRRGDDWFNLLQGIGLALFPLNPALLWLDRRLCRERELACDDGVLRATRAGRAYAACLVKLAEDALERRGVALALSALGTRAGESELMGRVRRILAGPGRTGAGRHVRLALGTLMVAAVAGAVVLASSPQWLSFDEALPTVAQSAAPIAFGPVIGSVASGARMEPAAAAFQRGVGRPVLVNAVMERAGVSAHRAEANRVSRRKARVRLMVKAGMPMRKPWATMPVKAAVGVAPGMPGMRAAVQTGDVSAPRLVVTRFEVSQPVYAAVPWGDGWLIVQL